MQHRFELTEGKDNGTFGYNTSGSLPMIMEQFAWDGRPGGSFIYDTTDEFSSSNLLDVVAWPQQKKPAGPGDQTSSYEEPMLQTPQAKSFNNSQSKGKPVVQYPDDLHHMPSYEELMRMPNPNMFKPIEPFEYVKKKQLQSSDSVNGKGKAVEATMRIYDQIPQNPQKPLGSLYDTKDEESELPADPYLRAFVRSGLNVNISYGVHNTHMRGTRGYLAPEWISGVAITPKADVYSYGMVLFEIISGRRNLDMDNNEMVNYFPARAVKITSREEEVLSLLDPRLEGNANVKELTTACRVACWCIQDAEGNRPSMGEIVQVLQGLSEIGTSPVPSFLKVILDGSTSTNNPTFSSAGILSSDSASLQGESSGTNKGSLCTSFE